MLAKIEWNGSIEGTIRIARAGPSGISDIGQLIALADTDSPAFSRRELTLLGVAAFFFALRSVASGREPILDRADRVLDSFYPVLRNRERDTAFQKGVRDLRAHLFPVRADSPQEVVKHAFNYLQEQMNRPS